MKKVKIYLVLLKLLFLITLIYGNNNQSFKEVCDDYFTFVCAKKDSENTKDRQDASRRMIEGIEDILNGEDNGPTNDPLSMERAWYIACMDARKSPQHGENIMQDILQRTGGYEMIPAVPSSLGYLLQAKNYSREISAYYAEKFGFSPFFEVSLTKERLLIISRPSQWTLLDLTLSSYDEEEIVSSFFRKFIQPHVQTNYRFEELQGHMLFFVRNFNEVMKHTAYDLELMTIESFQEHYDIFSGTSSILDIQWLQLFRDMGMDLDENDYMLFDLNYFTRLKSRFGYSNVMIATFIHLMYNSDKNINFYMNRDPYLEPLLVYAHERSEECIKKMPIKKGQIRESLHSYLLDAEQILKEIFSNMIRQFTKEINNSWLEGESKTLALELLQNMEIRLIYLNSKHQWQTMDKISYNFSVTKYGALQNFMNFAKAQTIYKVNQYKEYKEEKEARKQRAHIPRGGSGHIHKRKTYLIDIPFEELWRIKVNSPIARNYGHLATLIGIKISHGLYQSIKSSHYFSYPLMKEIYKQKMECFTTQLMNNHLSEGNNDLLSIEVSVALKVAYEAFKEAMKNHKSIDELKKETKEEEEEEYKMKEHDILLDPKNLNPKQLFFLSYATISCTSIDVQYDNEDNEIPLRLKINTPLSNIESFAEEFNCEINSTMNPLKKCDFWAQPETRIKKYFNLIKNRLQKI